MAQLNQSATDLPGALVTGWLAWIRLFDFDVRHVPGTKHSAADGLSRRPYNSTEKREGAVEQDVDDFVDAELNLISVCPIVAEESTDMDVLDSSYSARYLTTMAWPLDVPSGKKFRLLKREAMMFLVKNKHLFRRASKNVPLRRVVDSTFDPLGDTTERAVNIY